MEVADNSGTYPSLSLPLSLPKLKLARELRYEWSSSILLLHCVPLYVLCVVEGGPLYLYKEQGRCCGYSWREDRSTPPLHGAMPPPIEGVAERRWLGVAHPLTKPPLHCLCMVAVG